METTMVIRAVCTDEFTETPEFLVLTVDNALRARISELVGVAKDHGLAEAVISVDLKPLPVELNEEDEPKIDFDTILGDKQFAAIDPTLVPEDSGYRHVGGAEYDQRIDCTELVVYGPDNHGVGLRCCLRNTDVRIGTDLLDTETVLELPPWTPSKACKAA